MPEPLAAAGGAWFACGAQELHVGVMEDFAPSAQGASWAETRGKVVPDELAG